MSSPNHLTARAVAARAPAHVSDDERERRERALDATLAGTFPASDPPSSLPNPDVGVDVPV